METYTRVNEKASVKRTTVLKMNPQILALLTAIFWGVGGFFEKKGLHAGNLSPVMGITIRTAVALLILGTASMAEWKTVSQAGTKPLLYIIVGDGIVAGAAGMLCYYSAIKGAPLGKVMPIAFTSVWSAHGDYVCRGGPDCQEYDWNGSDCWWHNRTYSSLSYLVKFVEG